MNFVLCGNRQKRQPGIRKTFLKIQALSLLACILLLPVFPAIARPELPPGVDVRLEAAPKKATVGDRIRITLDVTTPRGFRAEILQPEVQSGDFTVLDFSREPAAAGPNGKRPHYRAQIIAAVYKTGKFTFPPIRIVLDDGSGKSTTVSSPSTDVEIRSIIDKNSRLKDLKKQADIRERMRWLLWAGLALAGCVVAALLWWFRSRWHRRRPAETPVPSGNPLDLSESDLRDLLARGLPTGGLEKKFYILLSDIVKRILEAGFGIVTAERTTSEIMESLGRIPDLNRQKMELIEAFLVSCDVVKFAKYVPSRAEHESAGEKALMILSAARETAAGRQSPAETSSRSPVAG